ncbi:hypothetical protein [Cytobacillus oceanisediminis]|uniref:hypothetical protein n=1 Tax=Cytobacillus oceanisediminis TaxID=665099 RepID=UPI001C24B50B|nr:hypothetical protein [Cytobacillus oceanisediminis]MBU8772007.1 hypothetical protein [Cytobacillus oceanisediminis]
MFKRSVSLLMVVLLCFSIINPALANESQDNSSNVKEVVGWEFEYDSFEEIPTELLEPGYYSEEDIIYIPAEYQNPYHPDTIGTTYYPYGNPQEGGFQTFAIGAAAGVYFIPGIGQVAITVTGALVIGGATIAAGSWLYNKVAGYFAEKAYEKAKKDGAKTSNHSTQSTSTKSSLDTTGKPLSSKDLKDSKGVKQRRYYDKNGKADLDIDYRHAGNFKFPHRHTWKNGVRSGH